MYDFKDLIENDSNVKIIVINESGEIVLSSKGAKDSFEIPFYTSEENISDYFPGIDFSLKGDSIYSHVKGDVKTDYIIKVGARKKTQTLITIEAVELSEQFESELQKVNSDNNFLLQLLNETSIISITDTKGNIKRVNSKFCEISGYEEEELIGRNQNIVNSGFHSNKFWKEMWSTIGKGKTWSGEIKNNNKSGKEYWVDTIIFPRMKNKKPYEYISIRREITERLKLREEVDKKALFYKQAAQLSKLGCWEIDIESQTPIWDDVVKEIHGVPMDYKPDMQSALDFFPPDARSLVETYVNQGFEKGTGWEFELPFNKASGEQIFVKAIGRVDKDGDQIKAIYGVFQDVTDRRNNEQIKIEKALAEKKAAFKERFLSNMSHEIRTPMNGVIGIVDLIMATDLDDYQAELLEIIKNSSDKLLKILNDILDLSKLEAGKFELKEVPFSLTQLANEVKAVFGSIVTQKALDFKVLLDSDLPAEVIGDETRLFQVLSNIVSNSIKFTDDGEVRFDCSVNKHKEIVFEISDTGIGIPEDKLSDIFNEFSQAEYASNNSIKGTGLGLSISKNLIELMGGRIHVESTIGVGSKFRIVIPFRASTSKTSTVIEQEKGIQFNGVVLVVEDNKTNQKVVGLMLKKLGIAYDSAYDGEEALKIFDSKVHSKILMDINMPVMDGVECTKILRSRGVTTPIIALTGNAMEKDIQNFKSKGFDEYITKPLQFKVLKSLFV